MHKNYEELSSVIKIILVLSHGQSAVECSFSLGKSFIVENISEESIRNTEKEKTPDFVEKESFLTMQDAEKKMI